MLSKFFEDIAILEAEETDLQKLEQLMKRFDWTYQMADRLTTFQREDIRKDMSQMKNLIYKLREEGQGDALQKLWKEKAHATGPDGVPSIERFLRMSV